MYEKIFFKLQNEIKNTLYKNLQATYFAQNTIKINNNNNNKYTLLHLRKKVKQYKSLKINLKKVQ